jgi:hypothetical protein
MSLCVFGLVLAAPVIAVIPLASLSAAAGRHIQGQAILYVSLAIRSVAMMNAMTSASETKCTLDCPFSFDCPIIWGSCHSREHECMYVWVVRRFLQGKKGGVRRGRHWECLAGHSAVLCTQVNLDSAVAQTRYYSRYI